MELTHSTGAWLPHTQQEINEGWRELRRRSAAALTAFDIPDAGRRAWACLPAAVAETQDAVRVRIEIPGADAGTFDIRLVDGALVVSGVKPSPDEALPHHDECVYGRFERIVPVSSPLNDEGAVAHYQDGVLTVTLAKSRTGFCRKIEVQGE
jgi:HSP20 family protein